MIQKFITTFIGIIRVKVSAIYLEPFGLGIVSQVTSFQNLLTRGVNLGVGSGVTKYVAQYHEQPESKQDLERLLQTVLSGFAITGVLIIFLCWVFAPRLADLMLEDQAWAGLIILTGIAVALGAQREVITRCLQGMLKIKDMVFLTIIGAIFGLCVTIPLVILVGVTGAVWSIVLSSLFFVIMGYGYLQCTVLRELQINLKFIIPDRKSVTKLLRFGGANTLQFLTMTLTILGIRSILIDQLGAESNGLYQVAYGVSHQYVGLISAAIWQYGLPRVTTILHKPSQVVKMTNDVLRLSLLVLVPLITFILVFRQIWIPILYSQAFLGAYGLIGWQMTGDFFKAMSWSLNITNVPKERFGLIISYSLCRASVHFGLFLVLLPMMGLLAAPVSYAISYAFLFLFVLVAHYVYDRFLFTTQNWISIGVSLGAVGLVAFFTSSPEENLIFMHLLPCIVLGAWGLIVVEQREVDAVLKIMQSYLTRLKK